MGFVTSTGGQNPISISFRPALPGNFRAAVDLFGPKGRNQEDTSPRRRRHDSPLSALATARIMSRSVGPSTRLPKTDNHRRAPSRGAKPFTRESRGAKPFTRESRGALPFTRPHSPLNPSAHASRPTGRIAWQPRHVLLAPRCRPLRLTPNSHLQVLAPRPLLYL